jgi:hypothetical protein
MYGPGYIETDILFLENMLINESKQGVGCAFQTLSVKSVKDGGGAFSHP